MGLMLTRKCKRMNQMSTPTLCEVFREVFGVRSKIWALIVPFFGTRKRALLKLHTVCRIYTLCVEIIRSTARQLHWADEIAQALLVVLVTNMRWGWSVGWAEVHFVHFAENWIQIQRQVELNQKTNLNHIGREVLSSFMHLPEMASLLMEHNY